MDTDAYSAHSTGLEALWAGVPLLSFARTSFASRPPSSFLTALGMERLIARTVEEYEEMAMRLLRAPAVLQAWRRQLWAARLEPASPFNEARVLSKMKLGLKMSWELAAAGTGDGRAMHIVVSSERAA